MEPESACSSAQHVWMAGRMRSCTVQRPHQLPVATAMCINCCAARSVTVQQVPISACAFSLLALEYMLAQSRGAAHMCGPHVDCISAVFRQAAGIVCGGLTRGHIWQLYAGQQIAGRAE